jgi:hypothetical protein
MLTGLSFRETLAEFLFCTPPALLVMFDVPTLSHGKFKMQTICANCLGWQQIMTFLSKETFPVAVSVQAACCE